MPALELSRQDIVRYTISLLQNELTLLRPGLMIPTVGEWSEETGFYLLSPGLDSLERSRLVNAVSEVFHLYETGSDEQLLDSSELSEWIDAILVSRQESHERLSFRSLGSGASPRLFIHEWDALQQEALEWALLFEGRTRIVSFVPCHEVYGFVLSVLLPKAMGIPVIDAGWEEMPALAPGDLVVSVPDQLQLLSGREQRFPRGVWVVSGTAPLPRATETRLRAKGLETLVEVYGSSEAGSIAYRYRSSVPFEALPFYAADPGGDLLRRLPDERSRAVEAPDHLRWVDARAFHLEGRKDEAVKMGGLKVYPRSIGERIAAHPYLAEAHVRVGEVHGTAGLKAMLVFTESQLDTPECRDELMLWMRGQLRTEEYPGVVTFSSPAPPGSEYTE